MKRLVLFSLGLLLFTACSDNKQHTDDDNDNSAYYDESSYSDEESGDWGNSSIKDGTYEAEVRYYNPSTGTHSTYTLEVEVEDEKLVKIYWNNGGWLDDSHFTPPDISDGTASFESDKGYEYEVELIDY